MINKQILLEQIDQKERELNNLKYSYDLHVETEKNTILKTKSKGMSKSLYLLSFEFESSSCRTHQYLEFHRIFKQELKNLLKPFVEEIEISKPNHFDVSGFFKLKDGRIFYIYLGDLRWDKEAILIRTAKHFKDYTGGSNDYISLDENFSERLIKYLRVESQ